MAGYLPENNSDTVHPVDTVEELLNECETIWKQMEEYQSKIALQGTETLVNSDAKLSLLMMRVKALSAEHNQWQKRSPELTSTNPDVLLALGKEELQKVKNDLEMVLSTVQSKNKQLEEDLKREQQWEKEQEEILNALTGIKEETKKQVGKISTKSSKAVAFKELQNKIGTLRTHKEKLLTAFGEFLDKHFPPPEKSRKARNKKSHEEPEVELITLHEILEALINKLLVTPHEPYVTINDSFWPPYIEMLLRYGIARRHPEDANRMRLEAFHM